MTLPPDVLPCARCRLPRPVSRFAPDSTTPPSRHGRAWWCVFCAPAVSREQERRHVEGQEELPLAPPERAEPVDVNAEAVRIVE